MYTTSCTYVHYIMYICMCVWYTVYNNILTININILYTCYVMYIVI